MCSLFIDRNKYIWWTCRSLLVFLLHLPPFSLLSPSPFLSLSCVLSLCTVAASSLPSRPVLSSGCVQHLKAPSTLLHLPNTTRQPPPHPCLLPHPATHLQRHRPPQPLLRPRPCATLRPDSPRRLAPPSTRSCLITPPYLADNPPCPHHRPLPQLLLQLRPPNL